jgi:hypothetical protein
MLLRRQLAEVDRVELFDIQYAPASPPERLDVEGVDAAEMVVDRRRVHGGALADLSAGGAVVAEFGKHLARRFEQLILCALSRLGKSRSRIGAPRRR